MKNKKCNGLRLITHIIGEILVVFGSVYLAIGMGLGNQSTLYYITGTSSVIVGAFCQWNPI